LINIPVLRGRPIGEVADKEPFFRAVELLIKGKALAAGFAKSMKIGDLRRKRT
jgi:hypothetical protein